MSTSEIKKEFKKEVGKYLAMQRNTLLYCKQGIPEAAAIIVSNKSGEPVNMRNIEIGCGYWSGGEYIKKFYVKQTIDPINVSEEVKKRIKIGTYTAMDDKKEIEFTGTMDLIAVRLNWNFWKKNEEMSGVEILVTDIGVAIEIPVKAEKNSDKIVWTWGFLQFDPGVEYDEKRELEFTYYELLAFTASGVRQKTAIYCQSELAPNYFNALEAESGGLLSSCVGKKVSLKQVVQACVRSTNLFPRGISYKMPLSKYGIAMYLGKLGGKTNKTDGASIMSDKLASDILEMSVDFTRVLFPQTRTSSLKSASVVMRGSDLYTFVKEMAKEMCTEIVYVKSFEDITEAMSGKFVLVGNPKHIDLFSDLSGFKFIPKTRRSEEYPEGYVDFKILQVARVSRANSNIQIHHFSMKYGEKFEKAYIPIIREDFIEQIKSLGYVLATEDFKNSVKGVDIKQEDGKKIHLPSFLSGISNVTVVDPLMKKGTDKNTIRALNKMLKNLKWKVKGIYLHGTPAIESWIDMTAILEEGEIFINDKKLENRYIVIIRNPRNSGGEYYAAKVLSLAEIIDRINKLNIREELKDVYKRFYAEISPTAVVVTGSDDFKNKTGGFDFDFDGFTVIWDERILPLIKEQESFSVDIKQDDKENLYYELKNVEEVMRTGFKEIMMNNNVPIGTLAYQGSTIKSILSCSTKIQDMIFKELFPKEYKPFDRNIEHSYERRFVGNCTIGEEDVRKAAEAFRGSIKNRKSIIAFFEDIEPMYISVVGRTIDSVKTGASVTDPIKELHLLTKVSQFFREKRSFIALDEKNDKFTSVVFDEEVDIIPLDKYGKHLKYSISDPLYRIIVKLLPKVVEELNKRREELISRSPKPNEQETNRMINEYFLLPNGKENGVRYLLNQVNNVYSDAYAVLYNKIKYKNGVGIKLKDLIVPYLTGTYRFFLDAVEVPLKQRFGLLKNVFLEMSTPAYMQCLSQEAIHYALMDPNANKEIKEEVAPLWLYASKGTKEFVNGVSKEFACTSCKFNGPFNVQEENGRFFFKIQIEDEVKIPRFEETDRKIMFRILNRNIAGGYNKVPDFEAKVQNAINKKSNVFIHIEPKDGVHTPSVVDRRGDYLYTLNKEGEKEILCRIDYYFKKNIEDNIKYPYVDLPILENLMIDPKTGNKRKLVIDQLISEKRVKGLNVYRVDLVLARFVD